MKIKIRIKTPKGNALRIEKKVRFYLLPKGVKPIIQSNRDNSQIIWLVDTDSRRMSKLIRNVVRFDVIISSVIKSKIFRKAALKGVGEKGVKELEDMIKNHTSCEIIKRD